MRNVALNASSTPYTFIVDVDFVPMPHLYAKLKKYISELGLHKQVLHDYQIEHAHL